MPPPAYDSAHTRLAVVRSGLTAMLASLDYPTYPPGTALEEMKVPGIIVGIAAARGASKREPTTLGRGIYEWSDPFAAQIFFNCPTDKPGALDSASELHAHELERAIEQYMFNGVPAVDNDEVTIIIQKVVVTEEILNIIETEDKGSAIIRGTVITGVTWN